MESEKIIKALECCSTDTSDCNNCPYSEFQEGNCFDNAKKDALSHIKSQDQKIFELENRLKECENGYKGTNFLDRCKLHDAEEKVEKLTVERDGLKQHNAYLKGLIDNAFCEKLKGFDELSAARACVEAEMWQRIALREKELTEENERLLARNFDLSEKGENVVIAYKKLSEENERLRKNNAEAADRNWNILKATEQKYKASVKRAEKEAIKAMQERLKERAYTSNDWSHGEHPMVVELDDIDQIAEGMLEV